MKELVDNIYARTKSVLTNVELLGNAVTYTFTGDAATVDNDLIDTPVLVFFNDASEGVTDTIPGFIDGAIFTRSLPPPPPTITNIIPPSGPVDGGTNITVTGENFTNVTALRIGGSNATHVVVINATTITATTPPGLLGPANVVVISAAGSTTLFGGFTYTGPPEISALQPDFGPVTGGAQITITG